MKMIVTNLFSILFYILLVCFVILLPQMILQIVNFFEKDFVQGENIATIISVLLIMLVTSNKIYGKCHGIYCKIYKKANRGISRSLIVALISFNDFIISIPKRTIVFFFYLFLTVADEMGYMVGETNFMFVGMLLIGIDRVISNWNKEKQMLYAYGKKAYGVSGDILDDLRKK